MTKSPYVETPAEPKRIISLGAGVQSSAMTLMALEGRFSDVPDCAVFADTQWEPKAVYDWLERLTAEVAPFPIHHVYATGIASNGIRAASIVEQSYVTLPLYVKNPDGSKGMGRRQCTNEFKLAPLHRFLREQGATSKQPIESWIGISTDEAHRMKPSRVKYAVARFPLIEAGLSRRDCTEYLKERMGSTAPKSACLGCPFHGDLYWANLRKVSPEEFEDVCNFDDSMRVSHGMKAQQFVHQSLKPLRQIKEFKHEHQGAMFEDAFGNECEGMCGL